MDNSVNIIRNINFTAYRNCRERAEKIRYIVIHYSGSEGMAADNVRYFKKNMQGFSVIQLPRGIAPFLSTNENKCLQNTCLA